jgi:hypothetical protein
MLKTIALFLMASAFGHAQTTPATTGLIRMVVVQPGTSAFLAALNPPMPAANTPSILLIYAAVQNPVAGQGYVFTVSGVTVKGNSYSVSGQIVGGNVTLAQPYIAQYGDSIDLVAKPPQVSVNIAVPTPAPTVVVN